jgi:hypothetical protein
VDCAARKGEHDELIIIDLSIASNDIIAAKYFMIPFAILHNIGENNAQNENNIFSVDRHISYS